MLQYYAGPSESHGPLLLSLLQSLHCLLYDLGNTRNGEQGING